MSAEHDHIHDHEYMHAHNIPHTHGPHGHTHSHEHTKAVLNRLSRAIGHLQSVRTMVEEGRDCSEVLIQIAAVRSAIDNTGKLILQDHLKHCIVDAAAEGDQQAIEDLCQAIDKYMK
ncbi:MAG: metal-sensing transcriptional repressor [Clostridia bacterium]|nr:metal-sensing transcriptional repressor [Clostridia bacterium]